MFFFFLCHYKMDYLHRDCQHCGKFMPRFEEGDWYERKYHKKCQKLIDDNQDLKNYMAKLNKQKESKKSEIDLVEQGRLEVEQLQKEMNWEKARLNGHCGDEDDFFVFF